MNPRLLEQIETLATKKVHELGLDGWKDDLVQEGALAALEAGSWRDVALQVDGAMTNYINRFILKRKRTKNDYEDIGYVEYEDVQVSSYPTPEEALMAKQVSPEVLAIAERVKGLSPRRVRYLRSSGKLAIAA